MKTGDELTEPSAFRSLARECKNGRRRAAFVAPHVSEEPMVFERLIHSRGPLLVECGWSFFSQQEIAKMRRRPEVDTLRFPSTRRRQHGATII